MKETEKRLREDANEKLYLIATTLKLYEVSMWEEIEDAGQWLLTQPHFTLDLNVTTLDLRQKKPKNALDNWTFYATKWTTNPPHIWFYFDLHNDEWLYLDGQKERLTTNHY